MNQHKQIMKCRTNSEALYALLFISLVQLPNYGLGEIIVTHRMTKKLVLTVQQDFIPFDFPLKTPLTNKTYLIISDPPNACSSVNPHPLVDTAQVHSVQGAVHKPNWVLLADDSDCDVHLKLVHAQLQGYSGVIIYSLESNSPNPMPVESHMTHLYKISVSFIGLKDGLELKKYAYPKQYIIKILQDWTFAYGLECLKEFALQKLEMAQEFLTDQFSKINQKMWKPLTDAGVIFLQILALTSPIWFLLIWYWDEWQVLRDARNNYRESQQDDYQEFFANFDFNGNGSYERRHQIPKDPLKQSSSTYDEYRKLLGVSRGDSKATIDSAFRKLSTCYHPDKNGHLPQAEIDKRSEIFKKMNKAREELVKLC